MTRRRTAVLAGCAGLWIALTAALLLAGGAVQRLDAAVRNAVLTHTEHPLLDLAVRACVLVGQRGLWLPLLVLVAGGASYPSGHAAGATVAYVLLALLLTAEGGGLGPGRRTPALVCAAGLSALTGIGVMLRDYHWASDSVAGWLLGAMVVLAASTMLTDRQPVPATEQGLR